jgi:hypothetical protein
MTFAGGFIMSVVETLKDKVETLASSAGDISKLTVDKIEEAANLNIASLGYFSNLCIRELRLLSSIRNVDSIQSLTADSISIGGDLTKRALEDGKAWLNLGVDYTKKVSSLLRGDGVANNDGLDSGKKPAVKSAAA